MKLYTNLKEYFINKKVGAAYRKNEKEIKAKIVGEI